jgi:hypothetical protein
MTKTKKKTPTQTSRASLKSFSTMRPLRKRDVIMATRRQNWEDISFSLAVSPQYLRNQIEQGKFTDEN